MCGSRGGNPCDDAELLLPPDMLTSLVSHCLFSNYCLFSDYLKKRQKPLFSYYLKKRQKWCKLCYQLEAYSAIKHDKDEEEEGKGEENAGDGEGGEDVDVVS